MRLIPLRTTKSHSGYKVLCIVLINNLPLHTNNWYENSLLLGSEKSSLHYIMHSSDGTHLCNLVYIFFSNKKPGGMALIPIDIILDLYILIVCFIYI